MPAAASTSPTPNTGDPDRRRTGPGGGTPGGPGHWRSHPPAWPTPEDGAIAAETRQQLAVALAGLPARQRIAVTGGDVNCDEFVELVTAYLEGALDPATAQRFVEHLAECAGCDRYLDQIRTTIEALGHLPAHSLAPEARDRLLATFRDWSAG